MSTQSPIFAIRTPLLVTIFDSKTGKMIYRTSSVKKSKIRANFNAWERQNAHLRGTWVGRCKVTYHRARGLWNESVFTTYAGFDCALRARAPEPARTAAGGGGVMALQPRGVSPALSRLLRGDRAGPAGPVPAHAALGPVREPARRGAGARGA